MNARDRVVVDASVVIKWFVEEDYSANARTLESYSQLMLSPDLLLPEAGNVFVKKIRRQEVSPEYASGALTRISTQVTLLSSQPLLRGAQRLALDYSRSFYASLYVALALQERCQLVTADERLFNALQHMLPDTLLWIGGLPETPGNGSSGPR